MRGAMGEMDLSCNYSDLDLALNMQLTGDCEASDALALVSPVSSPLSQNTSKNDWLDMLDKQQAQAQGPFKGQAASSATSVAASASEFVFPPRKRAKFDTSSKSVKGDGGSHSQSHFLPADLLLGYNL